MAKDDTAGYADQEQKDAQLEALKLEHEGYVRANDVARAKEVATYAKQYHNASLTTPRQAAGD